MSVGGNHRPHVPLLNYHSCLMVVYFVVRRVCGINGITECNIHRSVSERTHTALRDVNGKEFYPILVFNSPRESTQLHKSSNRPTPLPLGSYACVCDAIPPTAYPSPRYGRTDATLPKIDTKTSSEPRFNLKKKKTISPGTFAWVCRGLDGFIFTFFFHYFRFV